VQLLAKRADRIIKKRNKSNKVKCDTNIECKYKRNITLKRLIGSKNSRAKEFHKKINC
jgi:hypothetical protein